MTQTEVPRECRPRALVPERSALQRNATPYAACGGDTPSAREWKPDITR